VQNLPKIRTIKAGNTISVLRRRRRSRLAAAFHV